MGLKENVNNTQVGGTNVDGISAPNINLSNLTTGSNDKLAREQQEAPVAMDNERFSDRQQSTEQPPLQESGDQWKNIYDYVGSSDKFITKLSYDDFVSKYANDDVKKENLFSLISKDAEDKGVASPFKSSNIEDFRSKEASLLQSSTPDVNPDAQTTVSPEINESGDNLLLDPISSSDVSRGESAIDNIRKSVPDDLGDASIAPEETVNIVARGEGSPDKLSMLPNNPDISSANVDSDENLFADLWSTPNLTGVDKYDAIGNLNVDINTGNDLNLEGNDDIAAKQEEDRRLNRIKMTDDAAKDYVDKFFNTVRKKLSDGEISYEDIKSGGSFLTPAQNERFQASMKFNPQLRDYYNNSIQSMVSAADNIINTKKNVETRKEILSDFNDVKINNSNFSKTITDKFGGTDIEEVMLLNNKYYNSFVNAYAAKGFDAKDVKNAMNSHIQDYIYEKAMQNKKGWRSQFKKTLPEGATSEDFYMAYTEASDREGLKYMNQGQKQAAILNVEINELARKKQVNLKNGTWRLADEKELQDKLSERNEIYNDGALYNPETGEVIAKGEENEVDVQWGEEVKKIKSIYKDTDLDGLYKKREQLYFQLNWLENNITSNHTYTSTSSSTTTDWGKDEFVDIRYKDGKSEKRNIKSFIKDGQELGFEGNKNKTLEIAMPYTYGMAKDLRVQLTAINDLILFNRDPAFNERASMLGQTMKALNEELGGEDEKHAENQTKYQINVLKESGFDITSQQEDRLKDNTWQMFGNAIGGSIPAMGEILAYSAIGNVLGGVARGANLSSKLISGLSKGNKTVEKVLTATNGFMKSQGIYSAVNTGVVYEFAGQGFTTGIGESAGQGVAEKLFGAKLKKNPWAQFATRVLGGASGETIEEYSGEFLTHLTENGFDFGEAADKTAGENPMEKLLTTYVVGLMFSTPNSAIKTIDAYVTRKFIEENKKMFGNPEKVQEALDAGNEDGRIEERGKAIIAKEVTEERIENYNSLKEKSELTEEENLEVLRFESTVKETIDILPEEIVSEINESNPDLLSDNAIDSKNNKDTQEAPIDDTNNTPPKEVKPTSTTKKVTEKVLKEAEDVGDTEDINTKQDGKGEVKTTKIEGGTESNVIGDGKIESSGEEVSTSTDKGDTPKPVGKRILTKDENAKVISVKGSELQTLKDELGMSESQAISAKNLQRAYSKKKDADIEVFLQAVDRAKGNLEAANPNAEISVDTKSDIELYASVNEDIKKGEALIKEGNVVDGAALLEQAREKSKGLKDDGDKEIVNKRVDNFLAVSKAEKLDVSGMKSAAQIKAEADANKAAESEAKLEKVRTDVVGTNADAIASSPSGRGKSTVSGEVLKVDRTSTDDGTYEVLIKRNDTQAVKAKYNPETGKYSLIPQDKAIEKSQMSNFNATTERNQAGAKKEKNANRAQEITDEINKLSSDAGLLQTRGKNAGKPKRTLSDIINKIAYAQAEGATQSYLDNFNSELNGLIKDNASTAELKLKRKLQNLMKSAVESNASSTKAVTETKPVKKETTVKPKKAKVVKPSGNTNVDSAKQLLANASANIENLSRQELADSMKINGKHLGTHVIDLKESGKINQSEYNELQDGIKKLFKDKTSFDNKLISDAEKEIGGSDIFEDLDESMQTQPRGIGSNSTDSTERIQPRVVTKAEANRFSLKEIWGRLLNSNDTPSPSEIIKRLSEKTNTKLFTKQTTNSKSPSWLGKFNRSANAITLRLRRDVDTFIHEIGHKLSFEHGLDEAVSDGSFDSELMRLWDNGSQPPKTITTSEGKMRYKRNEGLAEFVRAYSINPDAAKRKFPMLNDLVESSFPESTKSELDRFGTDLSVLSNMTNDNYLDLLAMSYVTQTEVTKAGKTTIVDRAKKLGSDIGMLAKAIGTRNDGRTIGFWGHLNMAIFEKSGALRNTVKFAQKQGVEMTNSANPYYLIRLMSNYQRNRFKNLVEDGLVDVNGQRVKSKSGDLMNFGWLYENLDSSSEAKLDNDIDLVEKILVTKNLEWRRNENGGIDVTGAGFGLASEAAIIEGSLNELDVIRRENPERFKNLEEAANRYREFALQTVKYSLESGRITKEHYDDTIANQDNYVALRAVMSEFGDGNFKNFKSSSVRTLKDFKSRGVGSDVKRENPYSNLTAVLLETYYEGDRNHAVRSYVDMLSNIGGEVRSSSNKVDGDKEIKYYRDGVLKSAWISDDLTYALENATSSTSPIWGVDMMGRLFKDLPQQMITSTPAFAVKNLLRDKAHQLFISRRKFNPINDVKISVDAVNDFKEKALIYKFQVQKRQGTISKEGTNKLKELSDSQAKSALSKLELYGGTMSGWYFKDRSNYYGLLNEVKKNLVSEGRTVFWQPQRFLNPSKAWNKWHNAVQSTEEINRLHEFRAVYKSEKKKWTNQFKKDYPTMSDKDIEIKANHEANIRAAFEAKDLMDFTVSGHMMANMNRLFMFLNPALQGWRRAVKTFSPDDPKSWGSIALRLSLYSAIPTILERLYNAYNDDEDELREMPDYQKDLFWNFKIGGNTWFRTPKPFEFGMISSMISRTYDLAVNDDDNAFDGFKESLMSMFVPVDGTSLLDNPYVQLYTGEDYFMNKDIVPYYEQKLDLELRDPKYSSELGKKIHAIGALDARKFDHFMKKTFSSWGNMMLNVTDNLMGDKEYKPVLSQKDVGVLSESPLYTSRSYQAIQKMIAEKGVSNSNKELDLLNELRDEYSNATENSDKDRISEKFRKEAKRIRDKWDDIIERDGNLNSIGGKDLPENKKEDKKKFDRSKSFDRGMEKRNDFKRNK